MNDALTVDSVLEALRFLGWRYWWTSEIKIWESFCPVCRFKSLTIYDGYERVRLTCRKGCEEPEILSAFSTLMEPCTVDDALTLAEEALEAAYVAVGGRRV